MKTTDPAFPAALRASAEAWEGTPFVRLHSQRGVGADCTGLCHGVLVKAGAELPEMGAPTFGASADINFSAAIGAFLARSGAFALVADLSAPDIRPGDLLLYQITARTQHLALALDAATRIQAWPGRVAEIVAIDRPSLRRLVEHWRLAENG
jgi:cell wall-associated NlpC family hydrolase